MATQSQKGFAMPRILIVDDDQSVRRVLRFRLKDSYEIFETGSPEEALALALQHKPDAILLDLMLPRFSGLEVCQTLASMSFTQLIPVLIISGESAGRYKDFCDNIGARGYFQKPIDFQALQTRLDEILNGRSPDRRTEVRLRLRVMLTIRGTTRTGDPFEFATATENVSAHGFFCSCIAPIQTETIVDVFLAGAGQRFLGKARITRVERLETPAQGYGFQFVGDPVDWILR
jgi:DNA-binding response OmpR family regulator